MLSIRALVPLGALTLLLPSGVIGDVPSSALRFVETEAIPSFVASCKSTNVHRYDFEIIDDGRTIGPEWTIGERMAFSPVFEYTGGNVIKIDGVEQRLIATRGNVLFCDDYSMNLYTGSLFTYVINLEIGEIVASELNGSIRGLLSEGRVKARLISFDCEFQFGKSPLAGDGANPE